MNLCCTQLFIPVLNQHIEDMHLAKESEEWNSLMQDIVSLESSNICKNRLTKHWSKISRETQIYLSLLFIGYTLFFWHHRLFFSQSNRGGVEDGGGGAAGVGGGGGAEVPSLVYGRF